MSQGLNAWGNIQTGRLKWVENDEISNVTVHDVTMGYPESPAMVSCNSPIICQIAWGKSLANIQNIMLNEDYLQGDAINALFKVYIGDKYGPTSVQDGSMSAIGNMKEIATLRKGRDIPFVSNDGINPLSNELSNAKNYHTFTIDVAPIVRDYLSYTLVPLYKGAASSKFQMSGDYRTNDFWDYTSRQGSWKFVDILIKFEVKESNDNNILVENCDDYVHMGTGVLVNTATQFDSQPAEVLSEQYMMKYLPGGNTYETKFFTNCPNGFEDSTSENYMKPVRIEDEGEYLSFFVSTFPHDNTGGGTTETNPVFDMTDFFAYVVITDIDTTTSTINLRDVYETLGDDSGFAGYASTFWSGVAADDWKQLMTTQQMRRHPYKYLTQNVSPAFLNRISAGKISSTTDYYVVQYKWNSTTLGGTESCSENRIYKIDHTSAKLPYNFVRFHWVNRMGGIDSYTFKRNVTERIDITKTFFEKTTPNKQYQQGWDATNNAYGYPSDINRARPQDPLGGDNYKPSINTLSIDAIRNSSVYTEPINTQLSKWLEELFTSPNVWVELENDASTYSNTRSEAHPSTRDYFPVTINNTEFVLADEELGLVTVNIEYTHSSKVNTQEN